MLDGKHHKPSVSDTLKREAELYADEHDSYIERLVGSGDRVLASASEEIRRLATAEPLSLRDRAGLTVLWGVQNGLVAIDDSTGLAQARPFEGETSVASFDELRMLDDLIYVLKSGSGQLFALSFLGEPLATPSVIDDGVAVTLSPAVGLLAEGNGAPEKVYSALRPTLNHFLNAHTHNGRATSKPSWFQLLLFCFERPLPGRRPLDAVKFLLDVLNNSGGEIPVEFNNPNSFSIRRAVTFIEKARIATTRPVDEGHETDDEPPPPRYRTRRAQEGRPLTPWRAASRFARCFGVTTVPEREKDAARLKRQRP